MIQKLQKQKHRLSVSEKENEWEVQVGKMNYAFEKQTGILKSVKKGNDVLPFFDGPFSVTGFDSLVMTSLKESKNKVYIQAFSEDSSFNFRWTIESSGILHLAYSHLPEGFYGAKSLPFDGISFSLEEKAVESMLWVGDGPYRVWRNRMRGPYFGTHINTYNNTITGYTGSSYNYPEFKGFYSNFYMGKINLKEHHSITIFCHSPNLFLRMFTPEESPDVRDNMKMNFPVGDISFLTTILPIGTKFKKPGQMGPQSQPETYYNFRNRPTKVELSFHFEE